jgi:hypothetical protein
MSKIIFNLGLENNPWNAKECLFLLEGFGDVLSSKIVVSEYEGKPEKTLVAETDSIWFPIHDMVSAVRTLAKTTTQECIAFKIDQNDDGDLVGYVIGQNVSDDMEFNSDYFVE